MKIKQKFLAKVDRYIGNPGNIYKTLYPLYILSKLVFLMPFGLKKNNGKYLYEFSWKYIAVVVIEITIYVLFIFYVYIIDVPYLLDIQNKLQFLEGALSGALAVVEVLLGCIFSKNLIRVFIRVDEIENTLKNLNQNLVYR